ncbi:hypothetical protein Hdeb2414_s0003g00098601 [Helianthus debilis subsp. tardiflorus]
MTTEKKTKPPRCGSQWWQWWCGYGGVSDNNKQRNPSVSDKIRWAFLVLFWVNMSMDAALFFFIYFILILVWIM